MTTKKQREAKRIIQEKLSDIRAELNTYEGMLLESNQIKKDGKKAVKMICRNLDKKIVSLHYKINFGL